MNVSTSVSRCSFALVVLSLLAYGVSSGGVGAAMLGITLGSFGWWLTSGRDAWATPKWFVAMLLILVIARGMWTLGTRPTTSIAPFLTFLASVCLVLCGL